MPLLLNIGQSGRERGAVPNLKLYNTVDGAAEVVPRLAEAEADLQAMVEANMEPLLGARFLASEYSTGPVHGGRIDSLGLDGDGAPVVVEYKRGVDAGVINQGLYYLGWLLDHRVEFERLVRERLGAPAAARVAWSRPRVICVAAGFTRFDVNAVATAGYRAGIDLVRYQFFGAGLIGLETVASSRAAAARSPRRRRAVVAGAGERGGALGDLVRVVDEALVGLGSGVSRVQRKHYRAYRVRRTFACVCPPQRTQVLVYLRVDPARVELVPGWTRDVRGLGHHGTGDLEVRLRTLGDVERARELFRASLAAG
jgi:predicted transport protein